MTFRTGLATPVLAALASIAISAPALAEGLRIGGTGAVTEILRQLAPAFASDTGIALKVIPSLGTSGANNAVADGKLDLAVGGRELREDEKAKGLKVAAAMRTPFGFVTSRPGQENLGRGDIARIYQAARPVWPDGKPTLLILRPLDDSDNAVLSALFPGMDEALQAARKRRDLSTAATDQDNADMAEKINGSLAAATLTQIKAERRNLRFVSIDGVAPSLEAYLGGSYPYGKSLYVIVPAKISPEAQGFLDFLTKPAGQLVLRDAGIVSGIQ